MEDAWISLFKNLDLNTNPSVVVQETFSISALWLELRHLNRRVLSWFLPAPCVLFRKNANLPLLYVVVAFTADFCKIDHRDDIVSRKHSTPLEIGLAKTMR
jgi:hypothetical protein